LPRRRGRGPPPAPATREVEVRRDAHAQGLPRPPDGPLPDPLQPAAAPRPGRHRAGSHHDRRPGDALPGHHLAQPEARADRHAPAAVLRRRVRERRHPAPEPGHPRRAGHRLQHPARGHVQRRRAPPEPGGRRSRRRRAARSPRGTAMNNKNESTPIRGDAAEIAPPDEFEGEIARTGDAGEMAPTSDDGGDLAPGRGEVRRFAALVIITAATFIAAGHTLRQPVFMTANDISRWCTVWSLLERGTYVIDECPWHVDTQDKIQWPPNDPTDA